jgi:hypothetical protein
MTTKELYHTKDQRRISEAAMGDWEARSAPFCVLVRGVHGRVRAAKPSSNLYLYFTTYKVGVKMRIEIILIENTFWFGNAKKSILLYLLFLLCSQTL